MREKVEVWVYVAIHREHPKLLEKQGSQLNFCDEIFHTHRPHPIFTYHCSYVFVIYVNANRHNVHLLARFYSFALVASTGRKKRHTGSRVLKYNLNISHWNAGANKRCVVNIRGRKTYYFYLSLPSYHKLSATESEFSSLHRLERNVETRTRWIYSLYTWFPHHHPT